MSEEKTPTDLDEAIRNALVASGAGYMTTPEDVQRIRDAILRPLAMTIKEASDIADRLHAFAEQFKDGTFTVQPPPELSKTLDAVAWTQSVYDEPKEAGPTIAERLKAGEIPTHDAAGNLAVIVTGNTSCEWLSSSHGKPGSQVEFKYPSLTHGACFTIWKTGKATTGGKDSDLRQVLRDILESEGFDVWC